MFKYLCILSLGAALGYSYGWQDARSHDKHIAERALERIGGQSRAMVANDVDGRFRTDEKK